MRAWTISEIAKLHVDYHPVEKQENELGREQEQSVPEAKWLINFLSISINNVLPQRKSQLKSIH